MTPDEVTLIALEHIGWCQNQNLTPAEVLETVNGRCFSRSSGWDVAFCAVAIAWLSLRCSARDEEAA